jgi:hypothetical protein
MERAGVDGQTPSAITALMPLCGRPKGAMTLKIGKAPLTTKA